MSRPRVPSPSGVSLLLAIAAREWPAARTNPATGESSFTGLMSESDEASIGRESHPRGAGGVRRRLRGCQSSTATSTASASCWRAPPTGPTCNITFTVLDSPIVNAFAMPGGYVYVTRGLLALANSEAEVAGVLAHEIGHVTARHAAER